MAAASSSSTPFFELREEDGNQIKQQQQQTSMTPTSSTAPSPAPQKKKRNLPGTPYPDAEVIALSPKTLMATNRFVCEVCNKGFQREQNLQLHRRGHNLPWKLKQKSTKEVKRKVYLCPEPSCVHHDPSRALGDLTGIKKHFSRKHGEKKWKCDKCSKRYAVQSDWKAHSKTCGTREYRCDCGTLFSRRDSFITHRAFCDALAQESARQLPTGLNPLGGSHLYGPTANTGLGLSQVGHHLSPLQADPGHLPSDILRLGGAAVPGQFDHLVQPVPPSSAAFRPPYLHPSSSPFFINSGGHSSSFHHDHGHNAAAGAGASCTDGLKPFHGLLPPPDLPAATSGAGLFNMSFFSNTATATSPTGAPLLINDHLAGGETTTLFTGAVMADHHLGASLYTSELPLPQMSATALLQKAAQMGATTSMRSSFSGSTARAAAVSKPDHLQDLMNSLANGGSSHVFNMGGSDGMTTRDFLGVGGGMVRTSINGAGTAMADHHIGLDMSSLDSDMKSKASGLRTFGGASLH